MPDEDCSPRNGRRFDVAQADRLDDVGNRNGVALVAQPSHQAAHDTQGSPGAS